MLFNSTLNRIESMPFMVDTDNVKNTKDVQNFMIKCL